MKEIKTSIRSLVEYVYPTGSLDVNFRPSASLIEGTKTHQLIQAGYLEGDKKEAFLEYDYIIDDITIHIEGRCDGLLYSKPIITIDEIKSTSMPLDDIEENTYPVHWAQAKCYAYIFALDNKLNEINVQLTYVSLPSLEQKQFEQLYSFTELSDWFESMIQEYIPHARFLLSHRDIRNSSIKDLSFPYDAFRKGQRNFAGAVYKTISDKRTLFANAPTGTGKTISTLFPAVKAIGEEKIERIIYLTAKTITRGVAEEAVGLMIDKGLKAHSVTITAKDKICFMEERNCDSEVCPYAKGYYERINGAVLDILSNSSLITRETVTRYAKKHRVCPFEFSLDTAYNTDIIICDYNYIFDPRVSFQRLWNDTRKSTTLLVDEAHNLVERAREMYSATLSKSLFLDIKKDYKTVNKELYKIAHKIDQYFLALKKEMNESNLEITNEVPQELLIYNENFIRIVEKELEKQEDIDKKLLDLYFLALSFTRIAMLYSSSSHVTYTKKYKTDVDIKLFCVDPSTLLKQITKSFNSTILFSATFAPFNYFKVMLGWSENDYTMSIPSPFPKENLEIFIQDTSIRYKDREVAINKIIKTIIETEKNRPGNYLVFFPSYEYMQQVYSAFLNQNPSYSLLLQSPSMAEEDRELFLKEFSENRSDSLIAFAVLGGIFSEGIDLTGERLNGVIVVSVGLPKINEEQDIIKNFFNERKDNGFEYAYMFPGLNKVLQAGGRLIRTETDKGVIILIDDRFLQNRYLNLLPSHWQHFRILK